MSIGTSPITSLMLASSAMKYTPLIDPGTVNSTAMYDQRFLTASLTITFAVAIVQVAMWQNS